MTTTMEKTMVKPTWTLSKVQEEVATMKSMMCFTSRAVIEKFGPEALTEYNNKMTELKIGYFSKLSPKTPMELAKLMAEYEVNLTGSQIEVSGTPTEATLTFITCASWEATKKFGTPSPEQMEQMKKSMVEYVTRLGSHFGFTGSANFAGETLSFTFKK